MKYSGREPLDIQISLPSYLFQEEMNQLIINSLIWLVSHWQIQPCFFVHDTLIMGESPEAFTAMITTRLKISDLHISDVFYSFVISLTNNWCHNTVRGIFAPAVVLWHLCHPWKVRETRVEAGAFYAGPHAASAT